MKDERPIHSPLMSRFLRAVCPAHLFEEIEGDLIEKFDRDSRARGVRYAKKMFLLNTIRFFRPGIILRNKFSCELKPLYMLPHFFRIFRRTNLKNGGYSFINLSGLTIGLACSIFIFLWVLEETRFDSFHGDKDRIFQVMAHHAFDENTATYPGTPGPLADAIKELPEVEESFHVRPAGKLLFHVNDMSVYEEGVYAHNEIFRVFNFPVVEGDMTNAFRDDNSIAISQSMALKYFGNEGAIGKVFKVDNRLEVKVSAIFRDVPDHSSIRFEFVLPYSVYAREDKYNDEWGAWTGGLTYIKLRDSAMKETVNRKIADLFTKPKIWIRWDDNVELFLFPLKDWRLRDNFENGKQSGGRIYYVRIFSAVGIFILLIACINFMNLATARSISRSREVAVKKVVGAGRRSLVFQFIAESVFLSSISVVLALLIVHLLLPAFNDLSGKRILMDYTDPYISGGLIGITILTALLAGSYPAFVLSSLKTLDVMKGIFSGSGHSGLRKTLVVFQFSLSVVLIICALVVHEQIGYMRNKNLGFDKENVFFFNTNKDLKKDFEAVRDAALKNPQIEVVAQGDANPMEVISEIVFPDNAWTGKTEDEDITFKWIQCDYDYLPALGFTVVEGRNFSREFASDSTNYIITEEAARLMKLSDPIGQIINSPRIGQIVGVVKDFHSGSLQGPISPAVIAMRPEVTDRIFVRYRPGYGQEAVALIQALCKKFAADFPLEYTFLDESFNRQYQQEIMIGKLSRYFTGVAIFISGLGLFGLASFTAAKRTKEIGIRKVMGASVWQMVSLLSRDFIFLTGIALVTGLPIGWWTMEKFLTAYVFHTDIGISVFLVTGFSTLLVALSTVAFQCAKAALANPIQSLRTE